MLQVNDVHAGYGPVNVLAGVTLEVRAGETVALLGRNGAGKTTLLRTISGLITATSGSMYLDGTPIHKLAPYKIAGMGLIQVREGRSSFGSQTVAENLRLGAYTRRLAATELRAEIDRVYELFPVLAERSRQEAATLSGGERRMLDIGQALMAKPRLLLLDEPSHGLAPLLVQEVYDVIGKLRQTGTAILLAEQFAEKALAICDRAYILDQGRTIREGTGSELAVSAEILQLYLGKGFVLAPHGSTGKPAS